MSAMLTISERCEPSRALFRSGRTRAIDFREAALRLLLKQLETHETRLLAALEKDLGKPVFEAYTSETLAVKLEIRHFLKHLRAWSRNETVRPAWYAFPAKAWIQREPYGVALILAPWNYPIYLTLMPLVAAIAAGNTAVIKPSELAPHSAALLEELLQTLEPGLAAVVNGDASVAQELLDQPFDFFFFTGGGAIGKKVALAAAEKGVPCVLELGGKNPCIVEESAALAVAAKRIVWAKFFNAGQTCVAPDHVRVHRSVYESLLNALLAEIKKFYGDKHRQSEDLGRIVNLRHFNRLCSYLKEGKAISVDDNDPTALRFSPTLLTDITPNSAVLREEIFGPVLPVIPYDNLDALLTELREQPTPLALYLHTQRRDIEEKVLRETCSGSAGINEHILQATVSGLPFGGIGASGIGRYHGRHGFETFSHARSVLRQPVWWDNSLRYPPGAGKLPWIKRLLG